MNGPNGLPWTRSRRQAFDVKISGNVITPMRLNVWKPLHTFGERVGDESKVEAAAVCDASKKGGATIVQESKVIVVGDAC